MADKQYDVSPEERRNFLEKQKHRQVMREYLIKNISNPHRHATSEGGTLFDTGMFRWQAMRAKEYEYFRPTPKNSIQAFCLVAAPVLIFGYLVKKHREAKETAIRSGLVSYRDRDFKLV